MARNISNPGILRKWILIIAACLQLSCDPKSPTNECSKAKDCVCSNSNRCLLTFCDQVAIPGGIFVMGANQESNGSSPDFFRGLQTFGDSRPAHEVLLEPYCIDKYEVTVERYEDCVRAGACDPGESGFFDLPGGAAFQTKVNHYPTGCMDRGELCPTCPVNCRSFDQAREYCQWIGRRLCSEAEWERAAKGPGPVDRTYPWGSMDNDGSRANTAQHGPGHVVKVDSYPKGVSAEGVYNLAGNVYEWVSDSYKRYPQSTDGSFVDNEDEEPGDILLVGRGGCFFTDTGYRNADRTTFSPDFNWGCIGIRCCGPILARDSKSE